MSLLRIETGIWKPSDLPDHLVIKDVPREFVEIVYPAAADYVFREHHLDPLTPDPIIVDAAIAQAWQVLMEDKSGHTCQEWNSMWPSDRILTDFQELPSVLKPVFSEDTSVDRVVNEAAYLMGLERADIPSPPPGHPGQIIPLCIGKKPDLAQMAIADEVLRAAEWQCYLHDVGWDRLSEIYHAVLADVVKYVDAERDVSGLVMGHEDPFDYKNSESWQHPADQDIDLYDWASEIHEDIWNRARRATRHVKYSREDPRYSGHYALEGQKKTVTHPVASEREGSSAWER